MKKAESITAAQPAFEQPQKLHGRKPIDPNDGHHYVMGHRNLSETQLLELLDTGKYEVHDEGRATVVLRCKEEHHQQDVAEAVAVAKARTEASNLHAPASNDADLQLSTNSAEVVHGLKPSEIGGVSDD